MRRSVRTGVSVALGLLLLAALVVWTGPARLVEALRAADLRLVGAAFLCYAAFFLLRGWRWALLLRPFRPGASVWTATQATAVGWLANNVIPMRAGEAVRAGVIARRERAPFLAVLSTVAVERVFDVAGLALAAAVSLALLPSAASLPAWAGPALRLAAVLPLVALAILAAAAFARARVFAILERVLRPVPERARLRLLSALANLADGAEPVVRRPRLLAPVLLLTAAMTVAQVALYAFLLVAFLPTAPVLLAVAGAPWFILSFAIAVTPANVGTYEAAFTAIYVALGLPAESVLATAVLTHLATFGCVVVLGSLALAGLGLGPGRLVAGKEKEVAESAST